MIDEATPGVTNDGMLGCTRGGHHVRIITNRFMGAYTLTMPKRTFQDISCGCQARNLLW